MNVWFEGFCKWGSVVVLFVAAVFGSLGLDEQALRMAVLSIALAAQSMLWQSRSRTTVEKINMSNEQREQQANVYLVEMQGLIEPHILAGPFREEDLDEEVEAAIKEMDDPVEDILLQLTVQPGEAPEMEAFSGGYMEERRAAIAAATKEAGA